MAPIKIVVENDIETFCIRKGSKDDTKRRDFSHNNFQRFKLMHFSMDSPVVV